MEGLYHESGSKNTAESYEIFYMHWEGLGRSRVDNEVGVDKRAQLWMNGRRKCIKIGM